MQKVKFISEKMQVLYLNIDDFQTVGEHIVEYANPYMENCMKDAISSFNAIIGKIVYKTYSRKGINYISYVGEKFYGQVIKYNDVFYQEKIIVSLHENKEIRFMLHNNMYRFAKRYCDHLNISCYIMGTNKICVVPTPRKPIFEKIRESFLAGDDSILIEQHELSLASARVYCVRISKVFKTDVSCKKMGNDTVILFGQKDVENDFTMDFVNLISKYYPDYSREQILEICENSIQNFNSKNDDDFYK